MKRIFVFVLLLALTLAVAEAQDRATQERMDKLSAQIEDLIIAQRLHQRQMAELSKEISSLREQVSKPNASYLTTDDLKPLRLAIEEVDRKRIQDARKVETELVNLANLLKSASKPPAAKPPADRPAPNVSESGFEHKVEKGQTLSMIVNAFREKGYKVTVDDVLKANKGLKADKLPVGKTIWIPLPDK